MADKIPIERAAKQFGVPMSTLKDRVHGKVAKESVKTGPLPLFNEQQEALLANHLITMAEVGYGYSRFETIGLATDYPIHLGLR